MSFLSSLFGDRSIVDKAAAAIDASILTEQEKLDYYLKYQEATLPQNLARRIIATIVTALFAFLVVLAVVVYPFSLLYSQYIFDVLSMVVMPSFVIIVSFYFYKRIKE